MTAIVNVPALTQAAIIKVQAVSSIEVRLPSTMPNDGGKLYADVPVLSANGWAIELAYAKGCEESPACSYAVFTGDHKHGPRGPHVILAKGISGTYVASQCGASCSAPEISWNQGGVHYTISAQVSNPATELKILADSAITGPFRDIP